MSRQQLVTISKETLRYILTVFFAAVGAYIGIDRYINNMNNDIDKLNTRVTHIEENIGTTNIEWMYEQHVVHGKYISRLFPNQLSLAKDCKKTLLLNFDDLRGIKSN